MKAHKRSQFGVSGKGEYMLRTNVLITVGCNHSLPCLALKIREKKLLLNKSDKEWRIWFSFSFNLPLYANILCHNFGQNDMNFHCLIGVFVIFNKCSFTWIRGFGFIYWISQPINATKGFFF